MKFGVVQFPGTWSDHDCYHVLSEVLKQETEYIWHHDTDISHFDCIIVPGGFSYGDYLRPGAIARFSPVMNSIKKFSDSGGLVLGICNGFQILCESGLLPGALLKNESLQFRCQWVNLKVENINNPFTKLCDQNQVLKIPISHGDGRYYAEPRILNELKNNNQILFKYSSEKGLHEKSYNPNGSIEFIAGISNKEGNVVGMMPHPERCCESILGSTDGTKIFNSIISNKKSI